MGTKNRSEVEEKKKEKKNTGVLVSEWSLLKKFLCRGYGKDQVRDDNEKLRRKSPVTTNMA